MIGVIDPGLLSVLRHAEGLAFLFGLSWFLLLVVQTILVFCLRLFIGESDPVSSIIFESSVSLRWPFRLLRGKYWLPWTAIPHELATYPWIVWPLFLTARITATLAGASLLGAVIAALVSRI